MLINSLEKLSKLFTTFNYNNNLDIRSFQFDSRLIKEGDVFVALKAERDGHDFIEAAITKGAIACLVEDENLNINIPQFKYKDTWQALELIANKSREEYKGITIAVTGSCGKTTVKQMLLHSITNCYATEGNFNGLLGLPITLSHLNQSSKHCVLELGTDAIGNINKLTNMAKPDIAILTSIGPAHLEMFKTINNIIDEKLSIANGLSKNGIFIIPHEHLNRALEITNHVPLTFSINDTNAYAYIKNINGNTITSVINNEEIIFNLHDTASHKLVNALILLITLTKLEFDIEYIINKVETFKAPAGRGEQTILSNNTTLFDESYNANPLSMQKALESFKQLAKNKKIAILGDMLELGPDEKLLHKQLASSLNNIDTIYTVGSLMEYLSDELENKQANSKHFSTIEELLEFIKLKDFSNCDIIVKGSKGSKVSQAVELLKKDN